MNNLCLLTVHAHPDDESSKGAGTVALYKSRGVRTVLVCCTGGEEGEILNPDMDTPETRANLPEVREAELKQATRIIGYDEVVMLGYRDSGMAGAASNEDPRCFAQADTDEAVGKLVTEIRRARPQVIVTYDEEQSIYPHPDHLKVHEISVLAFDAAADKSKYPEAGEPWQPLKLYYTVWSMKRIRSIHEKFAELGLESPFDQRWFDRPSRDEIITTSIDVSDFYSVRTAALKAHRTQIEETSRFWFGLPDDIAKSVHPYDDYTLARSLVGTNGGHPKEPDGAVAEMDLFAGITSTP